MKIRVLLAMILVTHATHAQVVMTQGQLSALAHNDSTFAAGRRAGDTLVVMTVPLKFMSARDAAELLNPYATTPAWAGQLGGGVFPVPGGHAITIRERIAQYGRMLMVLREYDRAPRALTFTYQLILADKSGKRSPEIAVLDSALRSSLTYTGFSLLAGGVIRSGEKARTETSIASSDHRYNLSIDWAETPGQAQDASVELGVLLTRSPWQGPTEFRSSVFSASSVRVPLGRTVVLGSSAVDRDHAVILAMRVDLAPTPAKGKED